MVEKTLVPHYLNMKNFHNARAQLRNGNYVYAYASLQCLLLGPQHAVQ